MPATLMFDVVVLRCTNRQVLLIFVWSRRYHCIFIGSSHLFCRGCCDSRENTASLSQFLGKLTHTTKTFFWLLVQCLHYDSFNCRKNIKDALMQRLWRNIE